MPGRAPAPPGYARRINDLDIYRAAQTTIWVHGEAAELHVAQRAAELTVQVDMEGRRLLPIQEQIKSVEQIRVRAIAESW